MIAIHAPIPHSRPFIGDEEILAASAIVRSRQLAQGPAVGRLEQDWCAATGRQHAAAVGSGLGAIRLALWALGVRADDEVIAPAYTCVALLNAVLALGARPVLADVEEDRWVLDTRDTLRRITAKTKAIVAVHLFGCRADIAGLLTSGVPVIEDCAHAVGSTPSGLRFGDAGTVNVSSFYATKLLAGGEGGIVAADDRAVIDRIGRARGYDDREASPFHLNDKMTDVEAAIVGAQLGKLDRILSLRRARAERYERLLIASGARALVLPPSGPDRVWYRYAVRLRHHDARRVVSWMGSQGVCVERPVRDLRSSRFWTDDLPVAALACERVISLPLYPDLTDAQQDAVHRAVTAYLDTACDETTPPMEP